MTPRKALAVLCALAWAPLAHAANLPAAPPTAGGGYATNQPVTPLDENGTPSGTTTNPLKVNIVAGGAGGGPVTGAAASFADGWSVTTGTEADAACATDAGTCSEIALLKRDNARLTSILTALGTPIQATGGTVQGVAGTTGGATALCTGQIKATATACGSAAAHQVYLYQLDNTQNTTETWFQVFDVAVGSVTLGTTVAAREIGVGAGMEMVIPVGVGDSFANQVTLACTTTAAGLTAPTNNCGYTILGK